ncbi:MAG: hypothetical protein VKJ64_03110 [Leptolyngbyaceae bacterium]|nr:hypothetical protein [Leptolyngbyaceae bacterium]
MKNPVFLWQIFVQIENHKAVSPLFKRLEVSAASYWDALSAIEGDLQGFMQHGDPSILAVHRLPFVG